MRAILAPVLAGQLVTTLTITKLALRREPV